MKTLIITFALIANFAILGNAQTIVYGYDLAGNRQSRNIVIPPMMAHGNVSQVPNNSDLSGADKEQAGINNSEQPQPFKEKLATGQTVTIFPNPTQGMLAVEITNLQESSATLQIVDVSGKQHYIKNKLAGREEINLSNVPAGVYFLRITLDGKQEEWKIVKQ